MFKDWYVTVENLMRINGEPLPLAGYINDTAKMLYQAGCNEKDAAEYLLEELAEITRVTQDLIETFALEPSDLQVTPA